MSERDLAGRVGVSTTTVQSVESRSGSARLAEDVTVNQLRLMAEALGTAPADSLLPDPPHQPLAPADAEALGALLAHAARFVMREDLAQALGWTLDRLRAAEDDLAAALPAVGQRLVRGGVENAAVRIASATAATTAAETALDTIRRDAKGLHRAQAVVLWRITQGTFGLRSTTNAYRTSYAGLLEQGLAVAADDGAPRAGDAVLDAFDFQPRERRRPPASAGGLRRRCGEPLLVASASPAVTLSCRCR